MLLVYVSLSVILGSCFNSAASVSIVLSPARNVPVAINSNDNVTYTCNVDSSRSVLWVIQGTQLLSMSTIDEFRNIGVYIEEGSTSSESSLVITDAARDHYFFNLSVTEVSIQCDAFLFGRPPMVDEGDTFTVIIYGPPNPPGNLEINANPEQLSQITFSWSRPTNIPEGIEASYTVQISGARRNLNTTVSALSVTFLDNELSDCQEHTFSVFSSNVAGDGQPSVTTAIIPISPLVNTINDGFRLSFLSLEAGGGGTLEVTFPPATTCGDPFPIERYIVDVVGFPDLTQVMNITADEQSIPVTVSFDIGGSIQQGQIYFFQVSACISSNCRPSNLFEVFTTAVQQASITFFDNNALLTCTFANESTTLGCVIDLFLLDGSERFYLSKPDSGTMATQCNITTSQRDAYNRNTSSAADWLMGDMVGTTTIDVMGFEDIETEEEYREMTGCSIPGPAGGLAPGAIVGIVLGIIAGVIIMIGVIIVLGVVCYKVWVGRWLKVKTEDDDGFTVDFQRDLLMEERPRRKLTSLRKTGKVTTAVPADSIVPPAPPSGHASPDSGDHQEEPRFDAIDIRTAAKQLPAHLPEESTLFIGDGGVQSFSGIQPMESAQPQTMNSLASCITLDIKPGDKRVRLHLNKALIRRVLAQNNQLQSLDRQALSAMKPPKATPSFKRQESRVLSFPLTSYVVIPHEDEQQGTELTPIDEKKEAR